MGGSSSGYPGGNLNSTTISGRWFMVNNTSPSSETLTFLWCLNYVWKCVSINQHAKQKQRYKPLYLYLQVIVFINCDLYTVKFRWHLKFSGYFLVWRFLKSVVVNSIVSSEIAIKKLHELQVYSEWLKTNWRAYSSSVIQQSHFMLILVQYKVLHW